jgi:hypothetical protein
MSDGDVATLLRTLLATTWGCYHHCRRNLRQTASRATMATMSVRLLFALALAIPVAGQQNQPALPKPEQLLAAKLREPFLQRVDWCTDYEVALQRAAATDRLVFGYFTTAGP